MNILANFWISFAVFIHFGIHLSLCQSEGGVGRGNGEHNESIDYANLELNKRLLKGSRWAVEHQQNGSKIFVYHAIEIVDIAKVDVQSMSIRVEIHMRQRWSAPELKLPHGLFEEGDEPEVYIRADPKILDSLWSPESYIPYARESNIASLTTIQSVVNIFKNKTIVFKARLYTILSCSFSFQWYPLDKQVCDLTIESYTLPHSFVRYMWEDQQQPVTLGNLKLLQYDIKLPLQYTNGSIGRWGRSEQYPYVLLRFTFERQLNHHLIQVFTPTILVVSISWFSFWLGLDAVPGRISLLITCMLTLVTMHMGLAGTLPPVNYIKMMDIWMVLCMAFVFAAICEFVVVKFLHWRKQKQLLAIEKREKEMKEYLEKYQPQSEKDKAGDKKGPPNPYMEFYKNFPSDKEMMKENADQAQSFQLAMIAYQRRGLQENMPKPAWPDNPNVPYPPMFPQQMMNSPEDWIHPHPFQRVNKNRYPLFDITGQWDFPNNSRNNFGKKEKRPVWVQIDRISRFLFPGIFLLCNAVYWPFLLIGAANQ